MLFSAKVGAIEIAGDEVRVAVAKVGGKQPQILEVASCRAEYTEPEARFEAMAAALNTALDQLKSKPVLYVLCANCMYSVVRTLTVPFRGRKVAAAVPFELEPYLAFPIEELMLDYQVIRESGRETEVLAVGMRRQQVDEQLALLAAASIDVDAINLDVTAITALWAARVKPGKGLHALLHVRDTGSTLAIVQQRKLIYFRHLTCNAEQLHEDAGVLAREVQNTLRAFLTQKQGPDALSGLYVTGVELTPQASQRLSEAARVPVQSEVLLQRFRGGSKVAANHEIAHNRWEAVVGAAHAAAGGAFFLDFKPPEEAMHGTLRAVVNHLLYSSCLALFGLLAWAFYYHQSKVQYEGRIEALQQELESINQENDRLEATGLGIDMAMFQEANQLDILKEIGARVTTDKVTVTVVRLPPPNLREKSGWISIQGTASDTDALNQVLAQLRESTLFRIDEEPALSTEGGITSFTIKAFAKEVTDDETT
ncbi:MAG: pilus assembly protein PilM [Candidatus Hydrogenedentes bacterium]|nr:pilus assembly protein PilM [Candidatus Hydrogenedentota bacterium]